MNLKIKYYAVLQTLLVLLILPSCTIEKKLGKEFLTEAPKICIEVYTPQSLFKFSHKGEIIPGFDSLTGPQQDSALYTSSHFIKYVDDSLFLDRYVNSFIDELRNIGFRVFLDSYADTTLRAMPQAYVVNMSQVQLDEYFQPFEDSESIGDTEFYKTFDLIYIKVSDIYVANSSYIFCSFDPIKVLII